jgi:hypothetical protein
MTVQKVKDIRNSRPKLSVLLIGLPGVILQMFSGGHLLHMAMWERVNIMSHGDSGVFL